MPSYRKTVSIAASGDAVWRVLADVVAWKDWNPNVTSVEPLDGRELRLGARYRVVQPKLRPAQWVVTQLEPPRRFAWETRSPGIRTVADHVLDESSPGRCDAVHLVSFSGLLAAPVGMLLVPLTERYVSEEAAALKAAVEGAAANGA